METKTNELRLSGSELLDYMKRFKNSEEFAQQHTADIKAFIKDVETLSDSISNLYEASKVPLALGGVVVKVEVTADKQQLFKAHIGDEASADMTVDMMKKILEA